MVRVVAVVAAMIVLFSLVNATTYYVSLSGSDSNGGTTIAAPFRTINKCASVAVSGDYCTVRAGTYRESVTIANNGVTIQNYNGESVTVSGADLITTAWSVYSGNIYKTSITLSAKQRSKTSNIVADNALYVDGQIMPTARWPNIPYGDYVISNFSNAYSLLSAATTTGTYTATLTDPLLASSVTFNMANAVKVTASFALMYYTGTCIVTSGGSGATSFNIDCTGRDGFNGLDLTRSDQAPSFDNYFYLWDNLRFLDTAGEWYYDSSSSTLYAYMPDGKAPSSHTIEAWNRHNTINFNSRSNIKISGINTFAGLMNTNGATGFTIENGNFRYMWHQTDLIGFNTIINNGYGIVMNSANNVVQNNSIGPTSNFALVLGSSASTNRIVNNVLYGCAYAPFFKCIAANANTVASGASQNLIVQNTGIYAGDQMVNMVGGIDMTYNDFYQSNLQRADFGTLYSYNEAGRDAMISHNYVHDSYAPVLITKYGNKGFSGASGIYIDNGGTNVKIFRNVVWGTSQAGLHIMGQYNGNSGYPPTSVTSNLTFAYNTIFGYGTGSSTQLMSNILFENNLITSGWRGTLNPGVTFKNDPTTGSVDSTFNPTSGSTLLNAGIRLGTPYDDQVPSGSTPAVGAKDPTLRDWLPGAYVRNIDIASLSLSCSAVSGGKTTCTITNIPIGRKLPLSFAVGVSSSPSGYATCTSTFTYHPVNQATGICANIPVSQTGTLYARLYGTTAWLATTASISGASTSAPTPTSATGSFVTPGFGSLRDANNHVWALSTSRQVIVDSNNDTTSTNVVKLVYINGQIWQQNNQFRWWFKSLPTDTWGPFNGQFQAPISADKTQIYLNGGGAIWDANTNVWTIVSTSNGQVMINNTVDDTTSNVQEIVFASSKIWQRNDQNLWWFKIAPSESWGPLGGTSTPPF